jgi:hypothetical protein
MMMMHINSEAKFVSDNIIKYLGGNKISAMIGNNITVSTKGDVTFKFRSGKDGINCCVILYNINNDTYDMSFYKIRGINCEKVNDVNNIVNTAFAGQSTGSVFEGEKKFDLVISRVYRIR